MEYKNAAIAAKKNNDIALAKQYLRMAKVRKIFNYHAKY